MSKTDSKDKGISENKKSVIWRLFPLVEDYTVETTLAVYSLNPHSFHYKVSNDIREILKARGYTRLYILYLFSRIGEFSKICEKPIDKLINKRCNEIINEIIPDVGKIFFAYGEPENKNIMNLVTQRYAEVKKRILDIKPSTNFYYFGELSESGYPKELEKLEAEDSENKF